MIWLSKSVLVSFSACKTTNYLIIKQEGTLRKVSFHKVTDAEFQGDGIKCISKKYNLSDNKYTENLPYRHRESPGHSIADDRGFLFGISEFTLLYPLPNRFLTKAFALPTISGIGLPVLRRVKTSIMAKPPIKSSAAHSH